VCSLCHPFFTGKAKVVDSGGRVDKFRQKLRHGCKKVTVQPFADSCKRRRKPAPFLLSWFRHRYILYRSCLSLTLFLPPLTAAAHTEGVTVRHVLDGDSVI